MRRIKRGELHQDNVTGIALSAVAGFASGLVVGMIAGGVMGDLHGERVQRAVRKLRGKSEATVDPEIVSAAIRDALRAHDATRDLDITIHTPGTGLIELTGVAPDAIARQVAGDLARAVPGADVVVNRILVNGSDLPHPIAESPTRT